MGSESHPSIHGFRIRFRSKVYQGFCGGYLICIQYDGRMGFFCCRCWSSKLFAGYIDPIDTNTVDPLIKGSSMGHHIDPIDVWQFMMTHWSRFLAIPYRRPRWKMALQNFPSFSPPAPWINGFGFQEGESWRWRFFLVPWKKNGHIGEYWLVVWNMTGLFSISYIGMSSFPLTNSIIFQDSYCTTNQRMIGMSWSWMCWIVAILRSIPGLVNVYKKRWKDPPFSRGKSTISMVIFNSYVKLPEGNYTKRSWEESFNVVEKYGKHIFQLVTWKSR